MLHKPTTHIQTDSIWGTQLIWSNWE